MSSQSKKRKNELKITLIFVITLAVCIGLGYLFGMLLGAQNFPSLSQDSVLLLNLTKVFTLVFWGINLLFFVFCLFLYLHLRSMWKNCSHEDDLLDQIEYKGNYPLLISSVSLILNLFLFASCIWFFEYAEKCGADASSFRTPIVLAFVFEYLWVLILQGRMIALEKEMNPEKQGNILDFRFQKVWMESCDEAQRMAVYHAAYSAFKTTNLACLIGWGVSFVSMFAFDTGLLPVFLVTAIYMANMVSYHISAMKSERPRR